MITQHPTAETRDAFWTMLWDHNAQTVVLLTPLTQTTAVFWPVKHEEYDLDYFKVGLKSMFLLVNVGPIVVSQVRFIESTVHEGHSTLDFVISSRYDDYELKVPITQYHRSHFAKFDSFFHRCELFTARAGHMRQERCIKSSML